MYEAHRFCKPVPITDLVGSGAGVDWVWEGLLAQGRITLFTALAKIGKTTLLSLLLREMGQGGNLLGCKVKPGRVLVVSEEVADEWVLRRERYDIGPHVLTCCMPFIAKPSWQQWEQMLAETVTVIEGSQLDLVVLDTLSHLWPVLCENDNAEQARAVMPTRALSAAGCSVLLIHHAGAAGERSRGGTELEGFADQLVHLQLAEPQKPDSRARTLLVRGRLTGSPTKLRMELNQDGLDYQMIEGTLKPVRSDLWAVMEALVPPEPPGWTLADFRASWPADKPCPSPDHLRVMVSRYGPKCGWRKTDARPPLYWKPTVTAEQRNETPDTSVSGCCYGQSVTVPSLN